MEHSVIILSRTKSNELSSISSIASNRNFIRRLDIKCDPCSEIAFICSAGSCDGFRSDGFINILSLSLA